MTPYKERAIVILDPLTKPEDFFFGPVPVDIFKKEGKVINVKYIAVKKMTAYEVEFKGVEEKYWFMEPEIIVLYS